MTRPRVIVTGASGFLGRHLLPALEDRYEVAAFARRSRGVLGPAAGPAVRWNYVDIAERGELSDAFERVRAAGPVDLLIHLAGHYDFTGVNSPEYRRTNVDGMRHVLDAARDVGVRDFVFASSVAACAFPCHGGALDELSPPDGDSPYAVSKKEGERMIAEYRGSFRAWIVRFAAIFSDWCEYEPLYRFLEMWLSRSPRRRVLAGKGLSAVPYLHARDAVAFLEALMARRDELDPGEVLLASPDHATSHLELFEAATAAHFGARADPLLVPAPVCRAGLEVQDVARRTWGLETFERPWMGRYIDLRMTVDAHRTRERLGWSPRPRLGIVRRMAFLVQNRKSFSAEWQRRNHAALKDVRIRENLRIGRMLGERGAILADDLIRYVCAPERAGRFPRLHAGEAGLLRAESEVLIEALVDAVRTGEKALFTVACREFASRKRTKGVALEELTSTLDALNDLCVLSLTGGDPSPGWSLALYDHVTMTVQFGADEAHEVYEAEP